MRVLIVEPNLTGHHAPYLRHMLRGVADLDQDAVVLTAAGASQLPQFANHIRDIVTGVTWDECLDSGCDTARCAPQLTAQILEASTRWQANQIWVPYADFVSAYMGARTAIGRQIRWPTDVEIEGLLFRGIFAYPAPHWRKYWRRVVSRFCLPRANWNRLHFLDPIPYELIRRQHPELDHRIRLMPEPVECMPHLPSDVARTKLSIPADGRYLAYIGALDNGPAIQLLLRAFREAELNADDRLLLAGPMADVVRKIVDLEFGDMVRSGQIVIVDRHLNIDEVTSAVMASDVVCVPLPFRVGSSSFLIRAAAARRPVLVDDFGWTGWAARHFDLGWQASIWDVPAFAASMRIAIANAKAKQFTPAAERFVAYHSPSNFIAHWTARIRERIGLQPDPNLIEWQWVLDEPRDSKSQAT